MNKIKVKAGSLKEGDIFNIPKSKRVYECYFEKGTIAGKTVKGDQIFLGEDVPVFIIATQLKLF